MCADCSFWWTCVPCLRRPSRIRSRLLQTTHHLQVAELVSGISPTQVDVDHTSAVCLTWYLHYCQAWQTLSPLPPLVHRYCSVGWFDCQICLENDELSFCCESQSLHSHLCHCPFWWHRLFDLLILSAILTLLAPTSARTTAWGLRRPHLHSSTRCQYPRVIECLHLL